MHLPSTVCQKMPSAIPRQRFDHLWCHAIPVAWRRLSQLFACRRCAMSNHGGLLPSSFVREADSNLHNSAVDSFRMSSDSCLSLACRLRSWVQSSRLTVRPTPSRCTIPVRCFVCPVFARNSVALCLLRCSELLTVFFRDSSDFLRNIFSASKCSLDFCIWWCMPLLSRGIACAVLEIILPRSSICISPAANVCVSVFGTRAVVEASSSFSATGLHPFICGGQAAFCW